MRAVTLQECITVISRQAIAWDAAAGCALYPEFTKEDMLGRFSCRGAGIRPR
jgi:hypothetical protein